MKTHCIGNKILSIQIPLKSVLLSRTKLAIARMARCPWSVSQLEDRMTEVRCEPDLDGGCKLCWNIFFLQVWDCIDYNLPIFETSGCFWFNLFWSVFDHVVCCLMLLDQTAHDRSNLATPIGASISDLKERRDGFSDIQHQTSFFIWIIQL